MVIMNDFAKYRSIRKNALVSLSSLAEEAKNMEEEVDDVEVQTHARPYVFVHIELCREQVDVVHDVRREDERAEERVDGFRDGGVEEEEENARDDEADEGGEQERAHPAKLSSSSCRVKRVCREAGNYTTGEEHCLTDNHPGIKGDRDADTHAQQTRPVK